MPRRRIVLPIVDAPHPLASVEKPGALPYEMDGGANADMVCGGCGAIVCEGFASMAHVQVDFQFVVVCPQCGKNNVLPASVAPNEDWMFLWGDAE